MKRMEVNFYLLINSSDISVENVKEIVPFGDVEVGAKRSAGFGAADIAQQILLSIAGSYAYDQLPAIIDSMKNLLLKMLQNKAKEKNSIEVTINGTVRRISSTNDIEQLASELEKEIEEE